MVDAIEPKDKNMILNNCKKLKSQFLSLNILDEQDNL